MLSLSLSHLGPHTLTQFIVMPHALVRQYDWLRFHVTYSHTKKKTTRKPKDELRLMGACARTHKYTHTHAHTHTHNHITPSCMAPYPADMASSECPVVDSGVRSQSTAIVIVWVKTVAAVPLTGTRSNAAWR